MTFIWDLIFSNFSNFFSLNGYLSELEENNHNYLDDCKTNKNKLFFHMMRLPSAMTFALVAPKKFGGVEFTPNCAVVVQRILCVFIWKPTAYCI